MKSIRLTEHTREQRRERATPTGVLKAFSKPMELVTEDCIKK